MSKSGGPTPEKGFAPRKVTDKRGGHIEPEGASPRFTGSERGQYPKDGFPEPDFGKATRETGSAQENSLVSRVVPPVATRASGDSMSMKNPVK